VTDLLTNLLQRGRGRVDALVPRQPSLFEPSPGTRPAPLWPERGDTEVDPVVPAPPMSVRRTREPLVPPPEDPVDDGTEEVVGTRRVRSRRRPDEPADDEPADPAPAQRWATVRPEHTPVVATREAGPVRAPEHTPAPRRPGRAQPRSAAARTEDDRRSPPVDPPPVPARPKDQVGRPAPVIDGPPPPAPAAERSAPRRAAAVDRPDPVRGAGTSPVGALARPPRGILVPPPAHPVPAARVVGHPAVPQAPTVQVTIGRVDIRAVPASAPPRRSPAPRATGLDEYLTERNRRRQA
jgi:hypothetical protein